MSKLKVLVVGSGGREHALGWALARSDSVGSVDGAPGNPGMAGLGTLHAVKADDLDGICSLAGERAYDLVVIGPENPLALGLADRLRDMDVAVFGPGAAGARLESSKAFAKEFMKRHGIPTAGFEVVGSREEGEAVLEDWGAPLVVKASGLAAGKGVIMAETPAEARQALADCFDSKSFGDAGSTVVLEKKLEGEEASVFVITDGKRFHVLPGSQDHKRALDGDEGPNTGGMGAYSPAPVLSVEIRSQVASMIIEPTLGGLAQDNIDFRGLLYVGLMMTENGPRGPGVQRAIRGSRDPGGPAPSRSGPGGCVAGSGTGVNSRWTPFRNRIREPRACVVARCCRVSAKRVQGECHHRCGRSRVARSAGVSRRNRAGRRGSGDVGRTGAGYCGDRGKPSVRL